MLADLLAHPGVEEACELGSRFGFMAFHGGNLEPGTDVIAARAAERAGASLYAVIQPDDLYWHVPSVAFDPSASPALAAFVAHVDVVVAIHGYGRQDMWTTLLAGGRNRGLAAQLAGALRRTLGNGFTVLDDLADIPRELRGLHRRNPVNLPRHTGVQLELPPRVRPGTGVPTHLSEYTDAIVDALVEVATDHEAPEAVPATERATGTRLPPVDLSQERSQERTQERTQEPDGPRHAG